MDYRSFRAPKAGNSRPTLTRRSFSESAVDNEQKDDFPDNASQWSETESTTSTGRSSIAESHSTRTSISFGDVDYYFGDEDQIEFPSYDDAAHRSRVSDLCAGVAALPSLSPPRDRSPSPALSDAVERAGDDGAIATEPSRHVDYLSHDWSEEDLWLSWKHLRSNRKLYSKRQRLENAAWRLWEKTRRNLGTVAPESINWMKDRDTTWLYGPFQTVAERVHFCYSTGEAVSAVSPKRGPAVRPILKKRTLSEALLHRDMSSSLLVNRAAAIALSSAGSRSVSPLQPTLSDPTKKSVRFAAPTHSTQEFSTPAKNVRFHPHVEQYIAVGGQDEHDEAEVEAEDELDYCLKFQNTPSRSNLDTSIWKSTSLRAAIDNSHADTEPMPSLSATHLRNVEEITPDFDFLTKDTRKPALNGSSYMFDESKGTFRAVGSSVTQAGSDSDDEDDYIEWFSPVEGPGAFDSTKPKHVDEQDTTKVSCAPNIFTSNYIQGGGGPPPAFSRPNSETGSTATDSDLESDTHSTSDNNSLESDDTSNDDTTCNPLHEANVKSISGQDTIGHLLDPIRRGLVDRVMEGFWNIFDQEWDSNITKCTAESTSSSTVTTTSASSGSATSPPIQRKRQRGNENDNLEDDKERKSRVPRRNPAMSDEDDAARFACPFRKHNPRQYNIYNNRVCALSHWSSIARVKEHLYRCHQISPHCKRCWRTFKTQQQLDGHLTVAATDICEVQAGKAPAGITSAVERQLRSRKKSHPGQTDEERWKDIYKLLFPNEAVPSPYFEAVQADRPASPDSRDLADYEDYIRRELPRLVRSNIEEVVRRETQPLEAALIGSLVGIIQDCQDRVFRAYRETQGMEQEIPLPTPTTTTSTSLPKTPWHDDWAANRLPFQSNFLDAAFESPMRTEYPVSDLVGLGQQAPVQFSDSGYASEPRCKCDGPCACPALSPDLRLPATTTGPVRDANTLWGEGMAYPDWHQVDGIEDEVDWWMNI